MNWIRQVRQYLNLTLSDFARKMGRQYTEVRQFEQRSVRITSFLEVCQSFYLKPYIELNLKDQQIVLSAKENIPTKIREFYQESPGFPTLTKALGTNSAWYFSIEGDDQQTNSIERIVSGLQGSYRLLFVPFTPTEIAQYRFQAVQRSLAGEELKKIAHDFRVSIAEIEEWCAYYRQEGMTGLEQKQEIQPVYLFPYTKLLEDYQTEQSPDRKEFLRPLVYFAKTKNVARTVKKFGISSEELHERKLQYLKLKGKI